MFGRTVRHLNNASISREISRGVRSSERSFSAITSSRKLAARLTQRQIPVTPYTSSRSYAKRSGMDKNEAPKLRYIFYVFLFSSATLYLAGQKVDKSKKPKTSFNSDREFLDYERETGLKRRHKLIDNELNDKFKFYVVPYVHADETVTKIANRLQALEPEKNVRIIDPQELIEQELKDESRKYSYLLQDLKEQGKSFPRGLITALIKEELQIFLTTRSGTFDTNFILKNYPQSTEEAIKFENDVSGIQKCLILHYDVMNELKNEDVDKVRLINNVHGYFETVGRARTITSRFDEMDEKLMEIALEDF